MTPAQGLRAVLLTCQTQILANANAIASADFGPDHVHQLRVGLRRLRSGLRLFDGMFDGLPPTAEPSALAALNAAAAAFFRLLGETRDGDVLAGLWAPAVQAALRAAGLEAAAASAAAAVAPALATVSTTANVVEIVQAAPQQAMLADLARLIEQLAEPAARLRRRKSAVTATPQAALLSQLRRRLQRWQTQVCADAARFAELDIEARHQLRKRLKRLRYGLEFYGQLSPARRLRNTALKPLQHAQQVLGELNDLALAIDASRADLADNPPAWFALGWLSARQQQLLSSALPVMQRLGETPPLWKS